MRSREQKLVHSVRFKIRSQKVVAMSKSFQDVDKVEDKLKKVTFGNIEEVISKLEDRISELTASVRWLKNRLNNYENKAMGADMAFRCLCSDVKRQDIRLLELEIKAQEEEEEKRAAK